MTADKAKRSFTAAGDPSSASAPGRHAAIPISVWSVCALFAALAVSSAGCEPSDDTRSGVISDAAAPERRDAAPPAQRDAATAERRDAAMHEEPDAGWTTLIEGEWTMPAGTEGYVCARHTVTEDLFVNAFDAMSPPGTHHTLLTMGEPNAPDGIEPCGAGDNRTLTVFGSGVGTNPLHLPEGVALKIEKGTQLLLNLHLFNTGEQEIAGLSGTRVRVVPEGDVEELAEGLLAGTIRLNIPAGETTTHTGYCTMTDDATLIAVAPHMHQLGAHEKVVAESSIEGEVTLYDDPYDFNEQSYYRIDPVRVARGDRIRVECTHRNTTAATVGFGESSLAEMCFAGLYRYPATGNYFICSDDLPAGFVPPAR